MIKLQVIGYLGRDCTVSEVNGKNVINFTVAHSEKFKDGQGNLVDKTVWVSCAYWTDRTAIAPYLTKGQLVFVEGAPEAEAYTNKDGQQAAALRLRVFTIQLLGKSEGNQGGSGQQQQQTQQSTSGHSTNTSAVPAETPSQVSEPADDLPF